MSYQKLMLQIGLVEKITRPMRHITKQIGELQKSGIKMMSADYIGVKALQPVFKVQDKMKTLRIEGIDTFTSTQDSTMLSHQNLADFLPQAVVLLKQTQNIKNITGKSLEVAALSVGIPTNKFQRLKQNQILSTQTQSTQKQLMPSFGASIFQTSDALAFLTKQEGNFKLAQHMETHTKTLPKLSKNLGYMVFDFFGVFEAVSALKVFMTAFKMNWFTFITPTIKTIGLSKGLNTTLGGLFGFSQATEIFEQQKKTQDKITPLALLPIQKMTASVALASTPMLATANKNQLQIQSNAQTNQNLQTAVNNIANQSSMNSQAVVNISTNQSLTQEDIKQWAFGNLAY